MTSCINQLPWRSEKKANKSKSDFLSRMSHDMREPLNGIIGLLKIAEKHFDDRGLVLENFRENAGSCRLSIVSY